MMFAQTTGSDLKAATAGYVISDVTKTSKPYPQNVMSNREELLSGDYDLATDPFGTQTAEINART